MKPSHTITTERLTMDADAERIWNALRETIGVGEPTPEAAPTVASEAPASRDRASDLHLKGEITLRFPDGAEVHIRDTLLLDQFGDRRPRPTGGNAYGRPNHHSRRMQGFGSVEGFYAAMANAQRRIVRGEPQYGLAGMRGDIEIHGLIGHPSKVLQTEVLWLTRPQIAYTFGLILTELPE